MVRDQSIVGVDADNEFGPRGLDAGIPRCRQPAVLFVANYSEPAILHTPGNPRDRINVGRGVVDDNSLPVPNRLLEKRVETFAQPFGAVIARDDKCYVCAYRRIHATANRSSDSRAEQSRPNAATKCTVRARVDPA